MGASCCKPYEPVVEGGEDEDSFGHVYSVTARKVGSGAFGDVYECFNKHTWEKRAVKFISRSWLTWEEEEVVYREVNIMNHLDHPYIVKLYDFFGDQSRFYIVMEMCEGGQLLKRITRRKRRKQPYTEKEARDAMYILFAALDYLHGRNIVHRDIKPENLLLVSEDSDEVKLADFGLATRLARNTRMTEWSGTPCYMAPEMVNQVPYGKPVDMWSAGVVMFVILCGFHPFYHSANPIMFNLIRRGHIDFNATTWHNISDDAKDLIRRLLVVDPSTRLTASQALQHPWMRTDEMILRLRSLDSTVYSMIRTIARRRIKAIIYLVWLVYIMRRGAASKRRERKMLMMMTKGRGGGYYEATTTTLTSNGSSSSRRSSSSHGGGVMGLATPPIGNKEAP